jgi:APA family basic amino acid/polyamine antiporter
MGLKKTLSFKHVFCIAAGAMISSGIFVLPGLAHAKAGPAVIVSYIIAGLLAGVGMLNISELATAMPKAGGDYFFVTRGMGPAAGTIAGLLTWFSLSLKSAFALVGMAAFAQGVFGDALPPGAMQLIAVLLCGGFVVLNLVGSKEAATLQVWLVSGLLILMGFYALRGLPAVDTQLLDPVAPFGMAAVLSTAGFVFVAYGGLLNISSIAEEVKNPGRTIPAGLILSLLVVVFCYVLMVLVTAGVMPAEELDVSLTPIADGARKFMGPWGGRLMSLAAMLAFISTANAGILAASRYILALSRDDLVPPVFSRMHKRFGTPHVAIIFTGGFVAASLFLKLEVLVEAASTVLIISYALSCICVIVLRESHVQNYRPVFRAPLYPWLQIIGVIGFGLLLAEMGDESYIVGALLILVGFLTYWFYGRKRANREYALLHLIERITARTLVAPSSQLEAELKAIIHERDDVTLDRFDHLVADCTVLDIDVRIERDDLLQRVAETLADRTGLKSANLMRLLRAREEESSTALTPHLAIPHIVLPEKAPFAMLLVRCREGVNYGAEAEAVKAVVVLAGARRERNFHLKALAAIAQTVQGELFETRWQAAKGEQALRDIFLLAPRRRAPRIEPEEPQMNTDGHGLG